MFNLITMIVSGAVALNAIAPTPATTLESFSDVNQKTADRAVQSIAQSYSEVQSTFKDIESGKRGVTRTVTVTAYTSEPRQTDSTPCISSDGSNICDRYAKGELICAAGDRDVPLGSTFYVEGYGTCSVADRMNIRYNGTGRVDIYLGYDTPAAYQWGLRKVPVTRLQ